MKQTWGLISFYPRVSIQTADHGLAEFPWTFLMLNLKVRAKESTTETSEFQKHPRLLCIFTFAGGAVLRQSSISRTLNTNARFTSEVTRHNEQMKTLPSWKMDQELSWEEKNTQLSLSMT